MVANRRLSKMALENYFFKISGLNHQTKVPEAFRWQSTTNGVNPLLAG
jgi:hypothetical protein